MTSKTAQSAWDEAYRNYDTELAAFVRDHIPSDEAADLLQEVWASYLTSLEVNTINQPRAWLYRKRLLLRRPSGRSPLAKRHILVGRAYEALPPFIEHWGVFIPFKRYNLYQIHPSHAEYSAKSLLHPR